jgi:autotransporter-associated beta strand protein
MNTSTQLLSPTIVLRDFLRMSVGAALVATLLVSFFGLPSTCAGKTWVGNGAQSVWQWNENWDPFGQPNPSTVTDVSFAGSNLTSNTNNFADWSDFRSLYFNSGASSFTITGNSIDFYDGKIENNSSVTQSLNIANFSFNNGSQEINPASGNLSLGGGGSIFNNTLFMDVFGNNGHTLTLGKSMEGTGGLSINQNSIVNLTASQSYTGDSLVNAGSLRIDAGGSLGGTIVRLGASTGSSSPTLYISDIDGGTSENVAVVVRGSGGTKIIGGLNTSGVNTFSGAINLDENVTFSAATGGRVDFSGQILDGLGAGNFRVSVDTLGTVRLTGSGANSGTDWTVQKGTLELSKDTGVDAVARSLTVETSGVVSLLVSNQVNDSATVSLSGGTITRGGDVSERFGNLTIGIASTLDYGADNAVGTLRFGTYTPTAKLTVNNFLPGNKLQFGSTISPTDLNNSNLFSFSSGFTTGSESGVFTITAIPEPSTYVATAGLLAMFLWPVRRRMIKDLKSILGLRPTGRERIEAYRKA